jgi:CubicO group peptidase (beta-lactamase class C family)
MMRRSILVRLGAALLFLGAIGYLTALPPARAEGQPATTPITKGQRVFVCGHSFHVFIGEPLAEMAQAAGLKDHKTVGIQFLGGSRTLQHWNLPDAKNRAKAALKTGEVDVLTLSPIQQPDEGVDGFVKLGLKVNPNLRVTVQASWGAWDGDNTQFPKGARDKVDRNKTPEELQRIHAAYFKSVDEQVAALNKELGRQVVFVVPVGQAVVALRSRIYAGKAPGLKSQADLFGDPIGHGTAPLQALAAYCHYAVIYRRSPVGLPLPSVLRKARNPAWGDDLNRLLQQVAWEAVTHHPLSGVKQRTGKREQPRTALPTARPEAVGLSAERLRRIGDMVRRNIDAHRIPGAVTLVARRGRVVYFEAEGDSDLESKTMMGKRTVFRMASSTKPVTAVAILLLLEEGKLLLTDPVSKFLPEFKYMKVAVSGGEGGTDLVPARREITIRDLLTHTSGLGSGGPGSKEMAKLFKGWKGSETLADFVPRLARTPLDFQPGAQWRYSGLAGFDTLARVVEVASGQPFDHFLRERLFEPLGMTSTFFDVPEEARSRQATIYRSTPKGLERINLPPFLNGKTYFSGAGGLASTAEDYARFAQMLLNGGELNGKRLLSPRTVALLGTNHTGDMFPGQLGRPQGIGFGLGVEVVQDPIKAGWLRSKGSYGWDGAFGTTFWVDPRERMVVVFLIQVPGRAIHRELESAVRQAIIK